LKQLYNKCLVATHTQGGQHVVSIQKVWSTIWSQCRVASKWVWLFSMVKAQKLVKSTINLAFFFF